nr:MAG TPA: hypothetical protein [Caudoviricetes sp.]
MCASVSDALTTHADRRPVDARRSITSPRGLDVIDGCSSLSKRWGLFYLP